MLIANFHFYFSALKLRTKSFSLKLFFLLDWDIPYNLSIWIGNWRHLIIHAINSCPQLNRLSVAFSNIIIQEHQTYEFIETMEYLLLWFVDEIVPRITSYLNISLNIRFALSDAVYVMFYYIKKIF